MHQRGHPSQYYLSPLLFNFSEQTDTHHSLELTLKNYPKLCHAIVLALYRMATPIHVRCSKCNLYSIINVICHKIVVQLGILYYQELLGPKPQSFFFPPQQRRLTLPTCLEELPGTCTIDNCNCPTYCPE